MCPLKLSIVQQVDGLLHKCQGVRVERDVFARSADEAICPNFGVAPFESTGSFLGWYECDWEHVPLLVATVKSHRGLGVFVVPADAQAVMCGLSVPTVSKTGARLPDRVSPWLVVLAKATVIEFVLPAHLGVRVVFAQFGVNGDFKAKSREEQSFVLIPSPTLEQDGPHLGIRPTLRHRVSPLTCVPTMPYGEGCAARSP